MAIKAFDLIKRLNPISTEGRTIYASNSEIRRWFDRKSIEINGTTNWKWDDELTMVNDVVLHPKGKRRCSVGGFKV